MSTENSNGRIHLSVLTEESIISVDPGKYTPEARLVQVTLLDAFKPLVLTMQKLLSRGQMTTPTQAAELAQSMSKLFRTQADVLDNIAHQLSNGNGHEETTDETSKKGIIY